MTSEDKIKLSICVPTHNRFNLFKVSLNRIISAIENYINQVEIVVCENPSLQSESSLVYNYLMELNLNKAYKITYKLNNSNIGPGGNILEVVKNANGEYCWIIGDDDFLKPNSIDLLLNKISNGDYDFLSLNYDRVWLNDDTKNDAVKLIKELDNLVGIKNNNVPSFDSIGLSSLIHPKFNNVYLGAVMGNVFKTSIWRECKHDFKTTEDFKTLEGTYPFLVIFAKKFMNCKVSYISEPLITVGEGVREWMNGEFWQTSLPLIYLKIFPEILDLYKQNGLINKSYKLMVTDFSKIIGNFYARYHLRRIFRKKVKDNTSIKFLPQSIVFYINLGFYLGYLKGFIKAIYLKLN